MSAARARFTPLLAGLLLVVGALAWPASAAGAAPAASQHRAGLPQRAAAQRAARWLAHQFQPAGYIREPGSRSPDLGETAQAVGALADARTDMATARRGLRYLARHVNAYVRVADPDGRLTDAPGQLAYLILDAFGLRVSPRHFGGTNLVHRLLATLQRTGTDRGLFGLQDPTYDGAYREGLALSALAAVHGATAAQLAPAVAWLRAQQCADGGWEAFRSAAALHKACPPPDGTTYTGPDTNSTALAVVGLAAVHAGARRSSVAYLVRAETPSAGFGLYPRLVKDADSTAEVIQALLAADRNPRSIRFARRGRDPVSALLSLQVAHGAGAGGFAFQHVGRSPLVADVLATEQAIPALLGRTRP